MYIWYRGRVGYSFVDTYLFYGDGNSECTFNDKNTVKYVREILDIFKAYTDLPFRLGLLLELSELDRARVVKKWDLEGHVAICHTLDVCTALYQSIEEIPEVSIRNFGDLYKNDKDFEWQVDILTNNDTISVLLETGVKEGIVPNHLDISYCAETLNCILDKLYKKNNGTDNN